jgi:hypothetical protein
VSYLLTAFFDRGFTHFRKRKQGSSMDLTSSAIFHREREVPQARRFQGRKDRAPKLRVAIALPR